MKKQGFTLIELLVVISIIGLLSSIVYTSLQTARTKARIAAGLSFSQSLYHVLGAEAVGVWSFEDDIADGQTPDGSGNGNNGTIYGNPVQEDSGIPALRKALKFDGVDDYINVSNPGWSDITKITVEMWVKPNSNYGEGHIRLISRGYVVNKAWVSLNINSATRFIDSWVAIGTDEYLLSTTEVLPANVWTHLVFTYDGTTRKIYFNSIEKANSSSVTGDMPASTQNLYIGDAGQTNHVFNGLIDEVRIYRQALTSAEIQKHYAEGLKKFRMSVLY